MNFLRFLWHESGAMGRQISFATFCSGAISGFLVTIILGAASTATDNTKSFSNLLMFAVALTGMMTAKRFSLRRATVLTEGIVEKLRLRLADKIRRAELFYFEKIGAERFHTLLTTETQVISNTATMAINASASAVMLVVAFGYIAFLSIPAFVLSLTAISVTIIAYRLSLRSVDPLLRQTVEQENRFFALLGHLLKGFPEIKMNVRKNHDLFGQHLQPAAATLRDLKVDTGHRFVNTTIITHSAFYVLLAVVIFLLPRLSQVEPSVIVKISAVVLFIFGPLAEVVGVLPFLAKASVAIDAIEKMEQSLDREVGSHPPVDLENPPRSWDFESVGVRDLRFQYENADGSPGYALGPINLTFKRGETVFIKGGNGSGKSTFLKLFTGLYPPRAGCITVNEKAVLGPQLQRYRELFSIIFTDFHLFDRLYGLHAIDDEALAQLIDDMELTDKTAFQEGRFTNIELSTGQRKRLALITVLLENKPILIFDEWAADQDPTFRRHFYHEILPALKKEGKTIIAATHDDHYFDTADRVLGMDFGRFVADESNN
ncbi:cyclic peptide export ABC transporter [Synoicihabitans lomoniglobus]|uniref:Cyclic peptide export ABC transporter n=1 Tax=Synoicihabitans lomoniglobus TaxID=2909285 RepID=A0AAF0CP99_9BACT|nr:cyclic peptide export ABC transporter [Opitutaceae bacterium LMO-M01]WED65720.1 cyclic peptide export ABC transporter [Opitutaceae bacterium LMO-M01]